MSGHECEGCGLVPFDLPDGVDPDLVFERDEDGVMLCQGCAQLAQAMWSRRSEWLR